jgi:hypothetical protein
MLRTFRSLGKIYTRKVSEKNEKEALTKFSSVLKGELQFGKLTHAYRSVFSKPAEFVPKNQRKNKFSFGDAVRKYFGLRKQGDGKDPNRIGRRE